jgi:NADPH:quinone reductase-like Zn-dependent oxidoreductase
MRNLALELNGGFGIDRLDLRERPAREPGPGEARLRVEYASLNRRDLLLVEGVYNPKQKLPIVPCSDGAGVVEAVGPGCKRLRAGDRAVLHFFTGWLSGEPDSAKLATALGGPGGDGTLQQTLIVPESALAPIPEGLSTEAAATLPCAGLTAWSAIVDQGGLKPGSVVVTQGTGGVSLFALQFARMMGARVIATTSSDDKAETLKRLGAELVVNYRTDPDWARTARDGANGPIDLIVDVGGADTLDASLRMIRPGGTIALIGVLGGAKASITWPLAVMRQVRLQGVTCGHREGFENMLRGIGQHGIDPVISHRFKLTDARAAFECMKANAHVGKIIVDLR